MCQNKGKPCPGLCANSCQPKQNHAMKIIGSEPYRYEWIEDWVKIPDTPLGRENGRTHGVIVAKDGRVFIFHQSVSSMLVYSSDGKLLSSWGNYPGAHGMTLVEEDDQEFLWLADQERSEVLKVTLDGKVVQTIPRPPYSAYSSTAYIPTWVAVNEKRHGGNGDIWVADGYGGGYVHQFDALGNYRQTLTGEEGAGRFNCPHGIVFDFRKKTPELYLADRGNHRVQVYSAAGKFIRVFGEDFLTSPDGFCFHGDLLIIPELQVRVTLCDVKDKFVGYLGNNDLVIQAPDWPEVERKLIHPGRFNSPHDCAADAAGNIYVVEHLVGGRIIKLRRL
jgi:hypothetical protein